MLIRTKIPCGNLTIDITRLDGLPFPSDNFDFVRIVGMGLAIPEDEWQPVLEVCFVSFFLVSSLVCLLVA